MQLDVTFPSDNSWDIPRLDPDLQAELLPAPFTAWGSVARSKRMPGTWHFYVDDSKFAALWRRPLAMLATACGAAVEPNWSTGDQLPAAKMLWDVYRKRWLARLWQSKGLPILVDLHVAPKAREINLLGVPSGWRAYATRGSGRTPDELDQVALTAERNAKTASFTLVVYGGAERLRDHCQRRGWHWFPNHVSAAARRAPAADSGPAGLYPSEDSLPATAPA